MSISRHERTLAGCTALALLVAITVAWLWHITDAIGMEYDEGVYLVSARLMRHGYPIFEQVFSSQPPLLLNLLQGSFALLGDTISAGRLVSVLGAMATCGALAIIAWEVVAPWAAPLAVAFCGTSVTFFWRAFVVDAEMPSLGFATFSIAVLCAPRRARSVRWCLVGGVLFGLALAAKILVAPFGVLLLWLVFWPARAELREAAWRLLALVGASAAAALITLLPHNLPLAIDQSVTFHLAARTAPRLINGVGPWVLFERALVPDGLLLPLTMIGVFFLTRVRPEVGAWLAIWLTAVVVFLATHTPLLFHHLIMLIPPMALAATGVVVGPPTRLKGVLVTLAIGVCLLVKFHESGPRHFVPRLSFSEFAERRVSPQAADDDRVVAAIRQLTSPTETIVTDDQMLAFRADRDVPPELCDTSFVRISAGWLTPGDVLRVTSGVGMVVIWTGRLSRVPGFLEWLNDRYVPVLPLPTDTVPTRGIYRLREAVS